MSSVRVRAHKIIDNISDKKIAEVLDFLEFLKIKEEVEATNDINTDEKILAAIRQGLKELDQGELFDLDSVMKSENS